MKNKFKKYRYLGAVYPEVSIFWEPAILNMLKKIDKLVKPKFIPRIILNLIRDFAYKNTVLKNWYWAYVLNMYSNQAYITQIKSKFAALRIYGEFSNEVQKIVLETQAICNNICEQCGAVDASHVMVKGWVKNLCNDCVEDLKNGINNRNSASN